jgi:hypothetical protein
VCVHIHPSRAPSLRDHPPAGSDCILAKQLREYVAENKEEILPRDRTTFDVFESWRNHNGRSVFSQQPWRYLHLSPTQVHHKGGCREKMLQDARIECKATKLASEWVENPCLLLNSTNLQHIRYFSLHLHSRRCGYCMAA